MERSLLIELIRHTKGTLDSIKKFTELSRGKFIDKEFGEFFYRVMTEDIERSSLILNSFINYIKATTPIRKKGTVNSLIDEVLKKHQVRLEENKAKVFRNLEKDLPETIVPDEQLRFIVDSVLQYVMTSMSPNGSIEFLTKSFDLQKETDGDQVFFKKNGRYIEILVAFTYYKNPMEQFEKELENPVSQKEMVPDLMLRLVDDIVDRNQGIIEVQFDETKAKRFISLKFPIERRKVVHYH
jgi:hypothetical protein